MNRKKVVIIGATGSLAKYVIDAVKDTNDIELTLFTRNKERLGLFLSSGIRIVEGNAMRYNDLKEAISGQDIVYVNLAGDLEGMIMNIIPVMKEMGVKRIIAISSIGVYETPLRPVLVPYKKMADIIEASGLEYTILRPDWFTNANEIDYALTRKGEPEVGRAISRKSIAAFIAGILHDPSSHVNENLGISKPN